MFVLLLLSLFRLCLWIGDYVMLCFLALCYHVLPASIPLICLCLIVVHIDVGDGLRCMTIVSSECRCYACSFASSWLNDCMIVLSLCHCMVLILDASGYDIFLSSVILELFMLVSMPWSSR